MVRGVIPLPFNFKSMSNKNKLEQYQKMSVNCENMKMHISQLKTLYEIENRNDFKVLLSGDDRVSVPVDLGIKLVKEMIKESENWINKEAKDLEFNRSLLDKFKQ
jgi:hypothetical protein